jgi:hypothetical protein
MDDVAALAKAADLRLPDERLVIVGRILGEWWPGCVELNRKMSDLSRRHLVPVTVPVHGDDHE